VAVAFSRTQTPVVPGQPHTFRVTAELVNAEGREVREAYAPGVTLAVQGDANGTLSLSTKILTAPSTILTVTYDGGALAGTSETFGTKSAPYATIVPSLGTATFRVGALTVYDGTQAGVTSIKLKNGATATLQVVEAILDVTKPLTFEVTSKAAVATTSVSSISFANANDVPATLVLTATGAGTTTVSISGEYVRYQIAVTVKK
jgi:hypothetical protein